VAEKEIAFTMIFIAILDCIHDSAMGLYEIELNQSLSREEIHSMIEILRNFLVALQANREDFRMHATLDLLQARFGEAAHVRLNLNMVDRPYDEIMEIMPQQMDLILDTWLPEENAYGSVHFQEEGVEFLAENLLGLA
jgi:hypothetical protein